MKRRNKTQVFINSLQANCENCHNNDFDVKKIKLELKQDPRNFMNTEDEITIGNEYYCKRCNKKLEVGKDDEVFHIGG